MLSAQEENGQGDRANAASSSSVNMLALIDVLIHHHRNQSKQYAAWSKSRRGSGDTQIDPDREALSAEQVQPLDRVKAIEVLKNKQQDKVGYLLAAKAAYADFTAAFTPKRLPELTHSFSGLIELQSTQKQQLGEAEQQLLDLERTQVKNRRFLFGGRPNQSSRKVLEQTIEALKVEMAATDSQLAALRSQLKQQEQLQRAINLIENFVKTEGAFSSYLIDSARTHNELDIKSVLQDLRALSLGSSDVVARGYQRLGDKRYRMLLDREEGEVQHTLEHPLAAAKSELGAHEHIEFQVVSVGNNTIVLGQLADQQVVLKQVDYFPDEAFIRQLERLERELDCLSPVMLRQMDAMGEYDMVRSTYEVTPFYQHGNLEQAIQSRSEQDPVKDQLRLNLVAKLVEVNVQLAEHGVFSPDVKPSNFLLDGIIKPGVIADVKIDDKKNFRFIPELLQDPQATIAIAELTGTLVYNPPEFHAYNAIVEGCVGTKRLPLQAYRAWQMAASIYDLITECDTERSDCYASVTRAQRGEFSLEQMHQEALKHFNFREKIWLQSPYHYLAEQLSQILSASDPRARPSVEMFQKNLAKHPAFKQFFKAEYQVLEIDEALVDSYLPHSASDLVAGDARDLASVLSQADREVLDSPIHFESNPTPSEPDLLAELLDAGEDESDLFSMPEPTIETGRGNWLKADPDDPILDPEPPVSKTPPAEAAKSFREALLKPDAKQTPGAGNQDENASPEDPPSPARPEK